MYAVPLRNDGQSNGPKHILDVYIYMIYYVLISCVSLSTKSKTGYIPQRDYGKGKGKFRHIIGHEGPEVAWRYSSTLSLTRR